MSSILTNNSAMVALQTLQSINKNLGMVQGEISTGKSVGSARDNAAVWAISKQMESDVNGFEAIQESLGLGQSTVATARSAAESITDLLTEIKGKVVAAQEENVDRTKIQADIKQMTDQIGSIVESAQFNGANLIDGTSAEALSVLSSLNRASDGTVTSGKIEVTRQNLSVSTPTNAQTFGTTNTTDAVAATILSGLGATTEGDGGDPLLAASDGAIAAGANGTAVIGDVQAGFSYQISLADLEIKTEGGGTATGTRTFEYVASDTDGQADVAKALATKMEKFFGVADGSTGGYTVTLGTGANSNEITIANGAGNAVIRTGLAVQFDGVAGSDPSIGGLGALANIDVSDSAGAVNALGVIDGLIDKSIDAAAALGSAQGRIDTQTDFVSNLIDNFKSGIGTLVDADMEEASARLQALQVQQQLATQSLSIANQAPQSILALFR